MGPYPGRLRDEGQKQPRLQVSERHGQGRRDSRCRGQARYGQGLRLRVLLLGDRGGRVVYGVEAAARGRTARAYGRLLQR